MSYNLINNLNFALLERGFDFNSSSVGTIGFLFKILATPFSFNAINARFTILSSKLWNVMIDICPPTFKQSNPFSITCSKLESSLLVAMRKAWKVLVAG